MERVKLNPLPASRGPSEQDQGDVARTNVTRLPLKRAVLLPRLELLPPPPEDDHPERPDTLAAALAYAAQGTPVFPTWPLIDGPDGERRCGCDPSKSPIQKVRESGKCAHPGKHPQGILAPRGHKDATTDPAIIRDWWARHRFHDRHAGISTPTGEGTGRLVIDLDARTSGKVKLPIVPLTSLHKLLEKLGEPTLNAARLVMVKTPSGGFHLHFKDPGGIKSGAGTLADGVDVRADGGSVMLPPSHGAYLLESSRPPHQQDADADRFAILPPAGELPELAPAWIEALSGLKGTAYGGKQAAKQASRSQADRLIALARQHAVLFHDHEGKTYADIAVAEHREVWATASKGFRRLISAEYYKVAKAGVTDAALNTAIATLDAVAMHEGGRFQVHRRVAAFPAAFPDRIILDLGDENWSAIEITSEGWTVKAESPVLFTRSSSMMALPHPIGGGDLLTELGGLVNAEGDDLILLAAFLIGALSSGPFPLLALRGEAGSAKTSSARLLRDILDPQDSLPRQPPSNPNELAIAATRAHIAVFDNLSFIKQWFSDGLCSVATGSTFAVRQHYSNDEEVMFKLKRPVILTSVTDVVRATDLADRTLAVTLPAIPEERRRLDGEVSAAFQAAHPRLLGALLDAAVVGLRRMPDTKLERLPRMADFAQWVSACEAGLWEEGRFISALAENASARAETAVEGDAVATAVEALLLQRRESWEGTATALLRELTGYASPGDRPPPKGWPANPRQLGDRLRRAAKPLRERGFKIEFPTDGPRRHERLYALHPPEREGFVE